MSFEIFSEILYIIIKIFIVIFFALTFYVSCLYKNKLTKRYRVQIDLVSELQKENTRLKEKLILMEKEHSFLVTQVLKWKGRTKDEEIFKWFDSEAFEKSLKEFSNE